VLDLLGGRVNLLLSLLTTTTQTQDEMESRFLLDVVVREGTAVFQLLSGENQTLLVWGNSFLVLDLGLDIFNRIRGLDLKSDGLARKGFNKDLHFLVVVLAREKAELGRKLRLLC
jgi:hypothetical protein